jgi:alpha-ketoglutarate-dependent taurine dioxygenase
MIAKEYTSLPTRHVAKAADGDLQPWFQANREEIETILRSSGGLLLTGFPTLDAQAFQNFATACMPGLLEYKERSTPRTQVGNRIYTSTEYPADQTIAMHNESSYAKRWPMRICFYCLQPATEGGETPIADSRRVYDRIDQRVRERFESRGVMYIRRFGWGVDLSWQESFGTNSREEVERYCKENGIEFEWKAGDKLVTKQVRQSAATHPQTGEKIWFNQAHLFHITNLPESLQEVLISILGEDLPRESRYGDGTPFEKETLDHVREVFAQCSVTFPWRQGDVLLLDNMLVSHGRKPFHGQRKILAAMADLCPEK